MLEQSPRRGTFSHLEMRRRISGEGKVPCSRRLGPPEVICRRLDLLLAQPIGGSRCRPQAVSRRTTIFGLPSFGVLAAPGDRVSMDSGGSLPAHLERDGLSHAARRREAAQGKRGRTRRTLWLQKSPAPWRSENRTLEARARASLSLGCRNRQAALDSEKRPLFISPDLGSERGRGSSSWPSASAKSAPRGCERTNAERRIDAETHHVTVLEIGDGSRKRAGVPCRWKTPTTEAGSPHLHGEVCCAV